MKYILILMVTAFYFSCNQQTGKENMVSSIDTLKERALISSMLDSFNLAAANADYEGYFNFFTDNAIFIGTDPMEHWDKNSFITWAKPYFDKKKAWNFRAIQRQVYFGEHPDFAWFDELLKTQMKICRGSGVLKKENGAWKVQQYVLSMAIPNEKIGDVVKIDGAQEDSLINKLDK